ncbi:MAG: PHP domain-containing protein [Candidatus Omnitrophica bacterium]|nr:PHP domain-containing protein [Candidatus Omnitrophota bacterium]MCM8797845.1 PHP domain-containing protein [Candidatus Omnitrophota bacterium]
MKNQFADLHIHSSFSDGKFSPREILEKAKAAGLSCIAVTDHDCVDALPFLLKTSPFYSLEIIPAVELTAEFEDIEVHLLGYFINHEKEDFVRRLKELCQAREERISKMVEKLNAWGIKISYQEVMETKGEGSVGRLHLADVLLKNGYVKSIPEAFQRYIGNRAPCYVERLRLLPAEAVEIIKEAGGIPVVAHPYKMNNDDLIKKLIKEGIEGIEVYYPEHTPSMSEHYLSLAREYSLLVTGGSDCHGIEKKKELGSIKIPYSWVEEMKKKVKK